MSLKTVVEEWSKKRLPELVKSYHDEGLRASGKWERGLSTQTTQNGAKVNTVIEGEAYTGALVGGRSKSKSKGGGGQSLRSVIRQWIDDKGITLRDKISKDSLAFLIARKIHREGIRVPNQHNSGKLISNVFTEQVINELSNDVQNELAKVMSIEVMKGLKE